MRATDTTKPKFNHLFLVSIKVYITIYINLWEFTVVLHTLLNRYQLFHVHITITNVEIERKFFIDIYLFCNRCV